MFVWVPKASKPDAGGGDLLEEQRRSVLEFHKEEEVREETPPECFPIKLLQRGLTAYFLLGVNPDTTARHLRYLGLNCNLSLPQTLRV